jgi:predicted nucleotidyltransferase
VLLKLIAYDDRPEHKQKDLQDIGNIIKAYHRIADDLLFEEEHIDLLELDSPLKAAGQLLGRQLTPIIKSSKPLTDRVVGILARHPFIIEEELQSGVSISINVIKEMETGLLHAFK